MRVRDPTTRCELSKGVGENAGAASDVGGGGVLVGAVARRRCGRG